MKQLELTLDPDVYKNYATPGKLCQKMQLTGISPLKGHNVSHAKIKLKKILPNLKKYFRSDILKKIQLNG